MIIRLQNLSAIRGCVLEVVQSLSGTKRVVNFDNLYTSPQLLIMLKRMHLYGRGTVRRDRKHVPKSILLTKAQEATAERGEMRIVFEKNTKLWYAVFRFISSKSI